MRRCSRSFAAGWLSVALLAGAHSARAATRPASPTELRATIARLQQTLGACAAAPMPKASACAPAIVGDDLRIGDPKQGGYEVHWEWLREALKKSSAPVLASDAGKRAWMLRDAVATLQRMQAELDGPGPTPQARQELSAAHSDAVAVLAQPEFRRNTQLTWWDRQKARFWEWLSEIFAGIVSVGEAAPWLWPVLKWSLIVLAAAGVAFFLLRVLARQRLRISLAGAALPATAWDRDATDWAADAEEFAVNHLWRDAVHCLYWAAIVSLEARRAWRHNPTRTPREYVRLLKAGSPRQQGLRALTRIFERVWYGLREARAEEYAEARALYQALAADTTAHDTASGTSVEPLQAGGAA